MPEPPGGGSFLAKIPKPALYVGGGLLVFGGYYYYKKRKAAAANNTGNTTTSMGAAGAGAYGAPLPGSGILAPILINAGGPSTSTAPAAPAPTGGTSDPTTQFYYGSNGGQLQEFINQGGTVIHKWSGVGGNWATETLGQVQPGSPIQVTQGAFNQSGRLDISAAAANGGLYHGWYTPQQGKWASEISGASAPVSAASPVPASVAGTAGAATYANPAVPSGQ